MAERRFNPRMHKRISVHFGPEEATSVGHTDDITADGFFIRTVTVQPPGKKLIVLLQTDDGANIRLAAQVRWAKQVSSGMIRSFKGGMGVRILHFESGEAEYRALCEKMKGN